MPSPSLLCSSGSSDVLCALSGICSDAEHLVFELLLDPCEFELGVRSCDLAVFLDLLDLVEGSDELLVGVLESLDVYDSSLALAVSTPLWWRASAFLVSISFVASVTAF